MTRIKHLLKYKKEIEIARKNLQKLYSPISDLQSFLPLLSDDSEDISYNIDEIITYLEDDSTDINSTILKRLLKDTEGHLDELLSASRKVKDQLNKYSAILTELKDYSELKL